VSLYARESRKTPGRVVCGQCGRPVAYLHEFTTPAGVQRMVYFEQGFICASGVWQRTPRNVARVRAGHRPQERGARPRPPGMATGGYMPPELIPDHPTPDELPALVLCPLPRGCGALNTIDSDRLKLTSVGLLPVWPEARRAMCFCCHDRRLPAAEQDAINRVFRRFGIAT